MIDSQSELSIIGLIMGASILVQIVLFLLLAASFISWSIIFTKRRLIRRSRAASDEFEASFWSGGDLNTLYRSATRQKGGSVGMATIFEAGKCVKSIDLRKAWQRWPQLDRPVLT